MKETLYERKEHILFALREDGEDQVFLTPKGRPLINQAKRASRKIQLEMDGGLGRGAVRVS